MNGILKLLDARWMDAPVVIWLAIIGLGAFLILAFIVILVGRIRLGWKSPKRQFVFETDNRNQLKKIVDEPIKTQPEVVAKNLTESASPKLIVDEAKVTGQAVT